MRYECDRLGSVKWAMCQSVGLALPRWARPKSRGHLTRREGPWDPHAAAEFDPQQRACSLRAAATSGRCLLGRVQDFFKRDPMAVVEAPDGAGGDSELLLAAKPVANLL